MEKRVKGMLYLLKHNATYIVFDRESTSTRPHLKYGKLLELSAIKIDGSGRIISTFDTLINPEMSIPKKITELTSITNDMVKNKPKYPLAVKEFIKFCGNYPIVAHNATTDIDYVNFYAEKIGLRFDPYYIDTITLARYTNRNDKNFKVFNLAYLAKRYHITNKDAHRAMADTEATMQLFLKFKKILRSDIYHAKDSYFEYIKKDDLKIKSLSPAKVNNMEVRSCNLWQKTISDKQYCRLYIKLYYAKMYNDVYYDFETKTWGIKGELNFTLPENYETEIMNKIAKLKKIGVADCYKKETYEGRS